MKERIFISKKCLEFLPDFSDERISLVDDINLSLNESETNCLDPELYSIFIITSSETKQFLEKLSGYNEDRLICQIVIFGTPEEISAFEYKRLYRVSEFRTTKIEKTEFKFIIDKSFSLMREFFDIKNDKNHYFQKLIDTRQDQEALIDIGRALSVEKDPDKLLRLILFMSKKITGADAGSIYLVETDDRGEKKLRFKYSHTFSRDIPLEEFVIGINKKSIAGYVAATGDVLNIPDVNLLEDGTPYSFNSSFDEKYTYISRSMLVVPMRNHIDEIIGVIQLINSKEDLSHRGDVQDEAFTIRLEKKSDFDRYVVTFNEKYNTLMQAIAGQAAIAIENNRLIKQIQKQFEEFVKASVTAIESRDPATSGHSFRVAEICREIALAINRETDGFFRDKTFTETELKELEYASLLHDFGKVYIDLAIFKKAKKLFPKDFDNLMLRLDFLYRYIELMSSNKESEILEEAVSSGKNLKDILNNEIQQIRIEKEKKLSRIAESKEIIKKLNEPTVTEEGAEEALSRIVSDLNSMECADTGGEKLEVITDSDMKNLVIRRGSLNVDERKEIESHVVHTYNFVSRIPWPPEYRNIPEIAVRHHEKLDGTGYPDRISGEDGISIQARMMAVADIYDALASGDRQYKKSVPLEKILKILAEEAEKNKLDKNLVELFISRKIYEKVNGHYQQ